MTNSHLKQVEECRQQFQLEMTKAVAADYEPLKIKYLGRNGLISLLLKSIGTVPPEIKPVFGKNVNELKQEITGAIEGLLKSSSSQSPDHTSIDTSIPGRKIRNGTLHPVSKVLREICTIFQKIGFAVVEGPEIETDYNNFTALNIHENHPARDMHDTFYFDSQFLLRTQTSPVQIRVMKNGKPPFRIISPGKVYRRDSDITHSPMFHQIEGLCIAEDINFGHLKFVLTYFAKTIFGDSCRLRFRPSYFPFTEPSAEIDISCVMCKGEGCRVCKHTGWLEILGAGMVNPKVLENVNLDPKVYRGYAFGMGVERVAMLKYEINDIRLFYENHYEFLNQFI